MRRARCSLLGFVFLAVVGVLFLAGVVAVIQLALTALNAPPAPVCRHPGVFAHTTWRCQAPHPSTVRNTAWRLPLHVERVRQALHQAEKSPGGERRPGTLTLT